MQFGEGGHRDQAIQKITTGQKTNGRETHWNNQITYWHTVITC
jgi:hypothetical protein